jgi:hypothetical protein
MGLNYPRDQGTEWFNLKQQVKNAFTSANSRVPYQKIAAGIVKIASSLEILAGAMFTFRYSDNSVGMTMGRLIFGGDNFDGVIINKKTGNLAFSSYNRVSDGYGFTGIYDGQGNVVISDDAGATQGLARPWIPVTFMNTAEYTSPPSTRQTTNTTDTAVVSAFFQAQHPKMHYVAYVQNPGAGTCEYKFKDGSGNTLASGTSTGGFVIGDFSLNGWSFGTDFQMDLTIRRSAGAGAVGITLISLYGRQT